MFGTKVLFITLSSLLYLTSAQTDEGSIPYYATLEYIRNSGFVRCGAVFLTSTTLLTTASCLEYCDPIDFLIRSGNQVFRKGGKTFGIHEFIIHPNFNSKTLDYDIAVIILKTPIPHFGVATEYIKYIDIANKTENLEGKTGVVSVWRYNNNPIRKLVSYELSILSREVCEEDIKLTERSFCGGYLNKDIWAHYDDGGPFVINNQLVGIISRDANEDINHPEIFTDVTVLKPWIDENTRHF